MKGNEKEEFVFQIHNCQNVLNILELAQGFFPPAKKTNPLQAKCSLGHPWGLRESEQQQRGESGQQEVPVGSLASATGSRHSTTPEICNSGDAVFKMGVWAEESG